MLPMGDGNVLPMGNGKMLPMNPEVDLLWLVGRVRKGCNTWHRRIGFRLRDNRLLWLVENDM